MLNIPYIVDDELLRNGLSPDVHRDSFERWAFSEDFDQNISIMDIPRLWNRNHPEYHISMNEYVHESIIRMVSLYAKKLGDKQNV